MERERECHILKLHEYCRICGENFPGSVKSEKKIFMRRVEKFTSRLDECFRPHVSTSKDISEMHPSLFCNTCYRTMTKFEEKQKKGESYFHSRVAIQWRPHLIQGQCLVCKKTQVDVNRSARVTGASVSPALHYTLKRCKSVFH